MHEVGVLQTRLAMVLPGADSYCPATQLDQSVHEAVLVPEL